MKTGDNRAKPPGVGTFLGLQRSTVGVLSMAVLVGLGEHMAERFLPIYLLALGGGFVAVGALNGMDNFLSAVYAYPGGLVADRIGEKRALLLFNAVALGGFLLAALFPRWQMVLVASVFYISWSAISLPAAMSLIVRVLPARKRVMGASLHALVRRVPMALGPVIGGVLIGFFGERDGVRLAFGAAFLLAASSIFFQRALIKNGYGKETAGSKPPRRERLLSLKPLAEMDPGLKRLLVADVLVRYCEQIPYAFVAIWSMKTIARPVTALQFGVLTAVETGVAIALYIPVAYAADKGARKPYVALTFGFFTLFPLVLLFSRSFAWLLLAFAVRGMKEFGEPTRKTLIMDLAPEGKKATFFGFYYLVRDLAVALAALGGAFLWKLDPAANLFTAAAFGAAGTAYFMWKGKDMSSPHSK